MLPHWLFTCGWAISALAPCMQAHKLDAMEFFKKFAVDPDELPDTGEGVGWGPSSCRMLLVKSRTTSADQGRQGSRLSLEVYLVWSGPEDHCLIRLPIACLPCHPRSVCLHRPGGVARRRSHRHLLPPAHEGAPGPC